MKKKLKKMLLVDNDPMHWQLFQKLFGEELFTKFKMILLFACSSEEAMQIISEDNESKIKLAVIDLMMPVVDGIELSKMIYSVRKEIPILLSVSCGISKDETAKIEKEIPTFKGQLTLPYNYGQDVIKIIKSALTTTA